MVKQFCRKLQRVTGPLAPRISPADEAYLAACFRASTAPPVMTRNTCEPMVLSSVMVRPSLHSLPGVLQNTLGVTSSFFVGLAFAVTPSMFGILGFGSCHLFHWSSSLPGYLKPTGFIFGGPAAASPVSLVVSYFPRLDGDADQDADNEADEQQSPRHVPSSSVTRANSLVTI